MFSPLVALNNCLHCPPGLYDAPGEITEVTNNRLPNIPGLMLVYGGTGYRNGFHLAIPWLPSDVIARQWHGKKCKKKEASLVQPEHISGETVISIY